jgi:hypothetical protein
VSYEFRPAKREQIALLLGIAGGTGSGKTFSAMRLAKGLSGGKRFAVIDTENGRALHYADQFEFDVEDLRAPFRPEVYADAIQAADEAKYPVIIVDSMSHEHAGDGGLLDWHESEYQRLGGRDAVKMTAWIRPKLAHKKMMSRLLQVRAHVILCFRAEEKIEIVKVDGKTEVRPKRALTGLDGWIPVTEKNLPYELTLSVLMTADQPGIPKPIKLQEQHKEMMPLDRQISEATGMALAAWAAGGKSSAGGPKAAGADGVPGAVSQAGSPSEPASPADVPMATEAQRRKLFAAARARGVDDQRLREILGEVNAGNESTRELPRALVDAVLAVIEAEPVPA